MDVRQATVDDTEGIRRVARDSLSASYDFLPTAAIETAVQEWYDGATLETAISDGPELYLVATVDGTVAGFSQSALVERGPETVGEIRWLHVAPPHRDRGIGGTLLERTDEVLRRQGADCLLGIVLADHEAGTAFYEANGFERSGEDVVEIGEETYTEYEYEARRGEPTAGEAREGLTEHDTHDDGTVVVDFEDPERGSQGAFFPAYSDPDADRRYGWFCGNCESFAVAMNTMGGLECNECTNSRKPTRWDAAYL